MVQNTKPVESPKKDDQPKAKTVPLSDLMALRASVKKQTDGLKEQLAEKDKQLKNAQDRLAVAEVDIDSDEDVKAVRKHLLDEASKLQKERAEDEKKRAVLEGEKKTVRAALLVADYKPRGLELDTETLLAEDDMESYVTKKYIEHLEQKPASVPEELLVGTELFETGPASTNIRMPHDMVNPDGTVDKTALAEVRKRLMPK